jgi:hypothetical protein
MSCLNSIGHSLPPQHVAQMHAILDNQLKWGYQMSLQWQAYYDSPVFRRLDPDQYPINRPIFSAKLDTFAPPGDCGDWRLVYLNFIAENFLRFRQQSAFEI